jgi:tetratricopeptide (TPR) repeat protein
VTLQAVGTRYRAVMHLSDNPTGQRFASERFDGDLTDVFEAEDDLAFRLSQSIRFSVYDREAIAMDRMPASEHTTEMLLARVGFTLAGGGPREEWAEAGPRLESILAANPNEASAWGMKACWHLRDVFNGWREISEEDRAASRHAARESVRRNERSDFAHTSLALAYLYADRDPLRALGEAERALELSPYAIARLARESALVFGGRPADALDSARNSVRISTRLAWNHRTMQLAAIGALLTDRADEAIEWARRSDQQMHDLPPALMIEAAACVAAGRVDEAHAARQRLLAQFPDFRLGEMRRWPFRNPADLDRFMTWLAGAGLPQ